MKKQNILRTSWGDFPIPFETPAFNYTAGGDMCFENYGRWQRWMISEVNRARKFWEQGLEKDFIISKPNWYDEWSLGNK
jgi:hypothetical protein